MDTDLEGHFNSLKSFSRMPRELAMLTQESRIYMAVILRVISTLKDFSESQAVTLESCLLAGHVGKIGVTVEKLGCRQIYQIYPNQAMML